MVGHKGKFFPRKCDLRNETDIRSMFDWISSHPDLGKVDVCINNAGMSTAENLLSGWKEIQSNMDLISVSFLKSHLRGKNLPL